MTEPHSPISFHPHVPLPVSRDDSIRCANKIDSRTDGYTLQRSTNNYLLITSNWCLREFQWRSLTERANSVNLLLRYQLTLVEFERWSQASLLERAPLRYLGRVSRITMLLYGELVSWFSLKLEEIRIQSRENCCTCTANENYWAEHWWLSLCSPPHCRWIESRTYFGHTSHPIGRHHRAGHDKYRVEIIWVF